MNYEYLTPYTKTKTQERYLKATIEFGSGRKAAKSLGVSKSTLYDCLERVKINAARKGMSPDHDMTHTVPDGFNVKGVSTLYGADGDVTCQWVKTDKDKDQQEEGFREFIEGLSSGIRGVSKATEPTKTTYDSDLMSAVIIGDAHIGMLAHKKETLFMDFNTDIAVKDLREAIDNLVDRSPNSETGVLVDVGDLHHSNSSDNVTAKGTRLDCDTRHSKVLKISGMLMRYTIDKMLKKFKYVKVVISKGNHNSEPSVALSLMLQFFYEKNNRVEVKDTIGHFHYLTHGDWLIGVNHGDMIKSQKLVSVMARDHKGWSKAKFRVWLCGHVHHEKALEIDGCTVRSFNTLAPRDAWHASRGYGARQSMSLLTFHKTKGMHSTLEYDLLVKTEV